MEKIDISISEEIFKLIEEKAMKEKRSISSTCRNVIEEYYKRYGYLGKELRDAK